MLLRLGFFARIEIQPVTHISPPAGRVCEVHSYRTAAMVWRRPTGSARCGREQAAQICCSAGLRGACPRKQFAQKSTLPVGRELMSLPHLRSVLRAGHERTTACASVRSNLGRTGLCGSEEPTLARQIQGQPSTVRAFRLAAASMSPARGASSQLDTAVFGMGCFWSPVSVRYASRHRPPTEGKDSAACCIYTYMYIYSCKVCTS